MKILRLLAFFLFLSSCVTPKNLVYLDETGEQISKEVFQESWRDEKQDLVRWDHMSDTARIAQLSRPTFEQLQLSYPSLRENIIKITGKTIPDTTVFLLQYRYVDDLCSEKYGNTWSKSSIRERKTFLDPIKKEVEEEKNPQVLYLVFFEEGIILKNNPNAAEEYFFTDSQEILRNSIFNKPTMCGSFALVKPNGQALVRHGEFRLDWMANFLEPDIWNQLFPEIPIE